MERSVARKFDISRTEARSKLELAKIELRGKSPSPQDLVDQVGKILIREQQQALLREQQRHQQPVIEKLSLLIFPNGSLSLSREMVPKPLARAGVSGDEWAQVYDSVADRWAPMLAKTKQVEVQTIEQLHYHHQKCEQAAEGTNPTDNQNQHQSYQQSLQQVYASSHAVSSVGMLSSNSVTLANYLLNSHNVLVQLKLSPEKQLGVEYFLPTGLEMTVKLNTTTATAAATSTCSRSNSPSKTRTTMRSPPSSPTRRGHHHAPPSPPAQHQQQQPAYNPDYVPGATNNNNNSNSPVVFVPDEDVIRC